MSKKLLSICIPTYNRQKFLAQNIDSIVAQITPELNELIELCISDNASTDGTADYLAGLSQRYPQLSFRYTINKTNLGADPNFLNAMNMGLGEFGWLYGDDDALCDGALETIIKKIQGNRDVGLFIFNRIDCDFNLKPKAKRYWLHESVEERLFDFSDEYQECTYYALGTDIGAVFSFISTTIYNRKAIETPFDASYIGTLYSYLFYMIGYLKTGAKLLYFKDNLILCRLGNSYISDLNFSNRMLVDYDFFIKFETDKFAKNSFSGSLFLQLLKKTYPFPRLLSVYSSISKKEWTDLIVPKLKMCGWTNSELEGVRRVGDTPNLYRSRFKYKLKSFISKFKKK